MGAFSLKPERQRSVSLSSPEPGPLESYKDLILWLHQASLVTQSGTECKGKSPMFILSGGALEILLGLAISYILYCMTCFQNHLHREGIIIAIFSVVHVLVNKTPGLFLDLKILP